jgi:para-aminobenzoate synthetase/4-amino-4-deoxychorismate lyase
MRDERICHALDWDLSAADVLRLMRDDPHPVALLGAWAGGGDIIASCPVRTAGDPFGGPDGPVLNQAVPHEPVPHEPVPHGPAAGPRFGGGWIGYLGYGASGRFAPVPPAPGNRSCLPGAWWGYYDHVLRRDRESGQWFFEAIISGEGDRAAVVARRAELERRAGGGRPAPLPWTCGAFSLTPSPDEHREAVRQAVEYIRQGDIFQANICLRLTAAFEGDPLDAFCAAAAALDPPYAAFLRVSGTTAIASLSPELFLRRAGNSVLSSPIKGTRPRPADPEAARVARGELEGSVKEGAENVMIVDLMRNDLSRVCVPGTVEVPALLRAEPHPGVWHLVSDVTGTLAAGTSDEALVAATFPPGSVTGAPKVRALEVIHELEAVPREAYTGAIGYRGPVAGLELNVAIRTFEFRESRVWLGSGGGVTSRSDPDAEFRECLVKAGPLIAAIGGEIAAGQPAGEQPAGDGAGLRPRAAMGVFTSLRVTDGRVADLDAHLARLEASTVELYGKRLPARLREDLAGYLAERPSGRLRVTARPVGGPLQVSVEVVPTGPPPAAVTLRPAIVPGGIGPHKWRDRRLLASLAQARDNPREPGTEEQLLLTDANGDVLETDRGNVFAVAGGVLRTPPLDGRLLPGVTRAAIVRAAVEAGIPMKETSLTLASLTEADEVFVTNSVGGIGRVRSGPFSEFLALALAERPSGADGRGGEKPSRDLRVGKRPGVGARMGERGSERARRGSRPLVVLVDNYDSFTYNLAHLLAGAGAAVEVVRNDEVDVAGVAGLGPDGIVISPGPCTPAEAGISVDVVRALGAGTPVLGICLGHQVIAVAYGGSVIRAVEPAHGYASMVSHDGDGVLAGLPARFPAARYHSLAVDEGSLPPALRVTARLDDGLVMGLRHASHPVEGLQFHPESILTVPHGQQIVASFLRATGTG